MEHNIRSVIRNIPIAVFVLDCDGNVIQWNKACELLTGIDSRSIVGTKNHWAAFYSAPRPVLADLVLSGCSDADLTEYYGGKFWPSDTVPGGYEGEGFFPKIGEEGRWLYFTAGIIRNDDGALLGSIETIQDISEQRRREEELRQSEEKFREISRTDPLTGLFNLRTFKENLEIEHTRAQRYDRKFSLVLIDIDDFKHVNDEFGHVAGDAVLKNVARCIRSNLRPVDSAYRYGGDEFFIIMPEISAGDAKGISERIRLAVNKYPVKASGGKVVDCSISAGVAAFLENDSADLLIDRADRALCLAKSSDAGKVVVIDINDVLSEMSMMVDEKVDSQSLPKSDRGATSDLPCNRSCSNWSQCTPIRHFDSIGSAIEAVEFDSSIVTRFTLCRQSPQHTILCICNT